MNGTHRSDDVHPVVIVDTDHERAVALAGVIEHHSAQTGHVTTGSAAVRRIEATDIHLLVIASLADGSARTFIGWVRRNYPGLPVLAIAENVEQSIELSVFGADHVVQFPAELQLLDAHLQTLLENRVSVQLAA